MRSAVISKLESLSDRPRMAMPKGKSRLEERVEKKPLTVVDEKAFKATVWKRDRDRCRCCGRKVRKCLERVPERGEVNHIHGRIGDLRFEDRSAILLCCSCHEKVTGRVNEKVVIEATKTFKIRDKEYTDARSPVVFRKVA